MPAARYSQFWPRMPAFALPSFYDGRIRINLEGRERCGMVPVDQYESTCEKMTELLRGCRNLLTGEDVVGEIRWPKKDPMEVGCSEADLYVIWKSSPLGFCTPGLGNIGPVPYRRTGGHTGPRGFLYLAGDGIGSGCGRCGQFVRRGSDGFRFARGSATGGRQRTIGGRASQGFS